MSRTSEHLETLKHFETAVIRYWRRHRDMTDHVVDRTYAAAYERYRAEARARTPKPITLTGLDKDLCDAVLSVCEQELGRLPKTEGKPTPAITVDQLLDCLRELRRSLERRTKEGGRQGYLTFVEAFIP